MEPEFVQDKQPTRRQVLVGGSLVVAGITASAMMPQGARAVPSTTQVASVMPRRVLLLINGKEHNTAIEPCVSLLDTLREQLGLTGTKKGCDHGQCGACTVLIDGRRVLSCLTLAIMQTGRQITTVEGLSNGETLHPVQQAFIDCDAFQCGYCTPGQLCSAVGLIGEKRAESDEEIRSQMSGNICRCGAYPNIVQAVRQAMGQKA